MNLIDNVMLPWVTHGLVWVFFVSSIAQGFLKGQSGWKKWASQAVSLCGVVSIAWLNYGLMDWFVTEMLTSVLQQTPELSGLMRTLTGPVLPDAVQAYLPVSHWGEYMDTIFATSSIEAARSFWKKQQEQPSLISYAMPPVRGGEAG